MLARTILLAVLMTACLCAYNLTLAQHLCRLTVASYCKPSNVKDWSCRPCQNSPIKLSNAQPFFNSTGDVLGIIGVSSSPKAIYLVFRGTVPWQIKNWIEDINFLKTKYPHCNNSCEVHRGFYHAYLQVQPAVVKAAKEYKAKFGIDKFVVTGHSLGGALATHAAVSLVNNGIAVNQFYTFGSPRVGDQKFSAWFESYIKTPNRNRITKGRDPVPHLPFLQWGFLHVDHQFFYKGAVRDGFLECADSSSKQDPNCSDKYKSDIVVTDHLSYFDIDIAGVVLACQ